MSIEVEVDCGVSGGVIKNESTIKFPTVILFETRSDDLVEVSQLNLRFSSEKKVVSWGISLVRVTEMVSFFNENEVCLEITTRKYFISDIAHAGSARLVSDP